MTPTHIDDRAERREVVGGDNQRGLHLRDARHAVVEHCGKLGHVLEPFECRLTPDLFDCALAGEHRTGQLTPVLPVQGIPDEERIAPHRVRCIRKQCLTHRRKREPPIGLRGEDAAAGEHAHQSIHRVGVGADALGDGIRGPRAVAQRFDDAELGHAVHTLRDPTRRDQVEHRGTGRLQLPLEPTQPAPYRINRAGDANGGKFGRGVGGHGGLSELGRCGRRLFLGGEGAADMVGRHQISLP